MLFMLNLYFLLLFLFLFLFFIIWVVTFWMNYFLLLFVSCPAFFVNYYPLFRLLWDIVIKRQFLFSVVWFLINWNMVLFGSSILISLVIWVMVMPFLMDVLLFNIFLITMMFWTFFTFRMDMFMMWINFMFGFMIMYFITSTPIRVSFIAVIIFLIWNIIYTIFIMLFNFLFLY